MKKRAEIARGAGALCVTLVGALTLLSGCATVPVTGRSQLALVPQAQMVAAADQNYDELLAQVSISSDADAVARVQDVGSRIASAAEDFMSSQGLESELRHYDWEFSLIDDDETVNAFCMPGGKIAVYSGILPVAGDDTGLAVVVGHEVAHAIARHASERMSQVLVAELGGMALSRAVEERPEETKQWIMLAYGVGSQVGVLLPYSRTHESEADRIGLILMAKAGYDPRAAPEFWVRMAASGGARPPEFLSTHPAPVTRIRDIESHMDEALEHFHSSQ